MTCTYDANLSKNARLAQGRRRFYIKPEAKRAEDRLHYELKKGIGRVAFSTNKVYIDIKVFKPRVNTDAINFIDAIADVLKVVIKVDDRWFSLKGLDWELDRENPRIIVKLYQPIRRNSGKA